ncbi:hypothetical protein PVL29_018678 [Vitis rotundifolia]|uniref:Uncharacterized protein n=1 Tax=Vitis rotundifolia TaxID=103349 RepID=A0AA38Z5K4_VITRO|nr:hypothetical protein PVL29_018678 [Vitis rotundifolia]
MSTPSRSRSSAMGDEGYFDWRESMERRHQENERQVQALLQETRRLREENDILGIQVSSSSPPHKKTRRPHTSRAQGFSLINSKGNLGKDPHLPARRHRMKAPTLLASPQKGDSIGSPNY